MALSQAHKADLATFETKTAEFSAYMSEHAEKHTNETLARARIARDELVSLKARIEGHVAAAGMAGQAAEFTQFLNGPTGGMKHLGSAKTGQDLIDPRSGTIYSNGGGVFGTKVWEGIQEPAYAKAFDEYIRKGERSSVWALKTLEIGLDPQGGYLAPPEQLQRIIERKPTPTRLAGMVEQLPVGRDAVIIPRVNYQGNNTDDTLGQIYTTGFRVTNTEEIPSSPTLAQVNDTNLFGSLRIDNFTHMIEGVLTNSMVEDPGIDVLGWVEGKFNETIDLFRDDIILNGTGVQMATGILPYAANASAAVALPVISTATTATIVGDDVLNPSLDIPEQYEDGIRYVFNKTQTYKLIRKLKDTNGRYLFGYGYQDSGLSNGKPTDLGGYPFIFSGLMRQYLSSGAFTSGTTPMICGDLKGYTQTLRLGFSVMVCRELLARTNQVLLIGRIRIGGMPTEPWRMRVLKVA